MPAVMRPPVHSGCWTWKLETFPVPAVWLEKAWNEGVGKRCQSADSRSDPAAMADERLASTLGWAASDCLSSSGNVQALSCA